MGLTDNNLLHFGGTIIGFDELNTFVLDQSLNDSAFYTLQSDENSDIGFVVVSPYEYYPDYEFSLNEEVIRLMKLDSPGDALVLAIVTLKQPIEQSTVNLLAPLIVNRKTNEGRQVVLEDNRFNVRAPLFAERKEEYSHADIKP